MVDIVKIKEIENTEPTKEELAMCRECGGNCCKNMGCAFIPSDFKELSFNYLKSKIDEGYISIDWYEGLSYEDVYKSRGYFLRVRNIGGDIVDPSWGGVCSKLTKDGCSFSYKDRPYGGKDLKPNPLTKKCSVTYGDKYTLSVMWLDYYDLLEDLYNYYR